MVRLNCSEGDIVECYFPNKVLNTSSSGKITTMHGKCNMALKEEVMHATSAVIFRNGSLCIRMIHTKDNIDALWLGLDEFIKADGRGTMHKNYDLFRVSYHDHPNVEGVAVPLGVAHIHTLSGISIVGTIHQWYPQDLDDYLEDTNDDYAESIGIGDNSIILKRLGILHKLSEIVSKCHDAGYLHTDLKPSNILLDDNEVPYLGDIDSFIHDNSVGECLGTANYMSPEMMSSSIVGMETDTWAFAQMMYEMFIPIEFDDLFDYDIIEATGYDTVELLYMTKKAVNTINGLIDSGVMARSLIPILKGIRTIIIRRPRKLDGIITSIINEISNN